MSEKLQQAEKEIREVCVKYGVFIEPHDGGKLIVLRREERDGTKRIVTWLGAI